MRKSPEDIIRRTVSIKDYIMRMDEPFKRKFLERMKTYRLEESIVEELKRYAGKIFVVVFSAEWCKDCAANVSVLALLADKTELNVRVFGDLKKDPLNPREKWRAPPSPPEAKEFKVERIPHIVIFDMKGEELGKIIENPTQNKTMEEEILQIAKEAFS